MPSDDSTTGDIGGSVPEVTGAHNADVLSSKSCEAESTSYCETNMLMDEDSDGGEQRTDGRENNYPELVDNYAETNETDIINTPLDYS